MSSNLSDCHEPLLNKLEQAIGQKLWAEASLLLQAFVDTWPVGACLHIATQRWENQLYDPLTLGVLMRHKEIMDLCGESLPELKLPADLPPYCELEGHELKGRRTELCNRAALDELDAVLFLSDPPSDPDTQLALGELRMEAKAQVSVDLYGLPGLLVPAAKPFNALMGSAPSGQMGEGLRQICDIAILPGIPAKLAQGVCEPVGWLLWSGPARPLPITPLAVEVLRRISLGVASISDELGLEREQVKQIVSEMVSIGAATVAQQEH